jgi:hypothetical protein
MYEAKNVLQTRKLEPVLFLNFSPDGKYIAAAFTSDFTIWSLEDDKPFHLGHSSDDRVVAQDWTLDGLCTIFASGWISTATITRKFSFVPFGFQQVGGSLKAATAR